MHYIFEIMAAPDHFPSTGNMERRKSFRFIHGTTVRVWHASIAEKLMKVRDVSNNGAFLICDWKDMPPLGSVIEMQVQDLAEEAPKVRAKLIRFASNGVGVAFCDE